jgi:hypothetical protein
MVTSCTLGKIATTENIWVIFAPEFPLVGWNPPSPYLIEVNLKPTGTAVANKVYKVDLYEKGKFRSQTTIYWNQPEINVSTIKPAYFASTKDENNAYSLQDISHIFYVEVHE